MDDLSGSPYGQFKDALAFRDIPRVVSTARQLRHLTLEDSLSVCLVLRPDDRLYSQWATRWHAKFVSDTGLTSPHESQLVLTALLSLTGEGVDVGRALLDGVFRRHGALGAVEVLRRYGANIHDAEQPSGRSALFGV